MRSFEVVLCLLGCKDDFLPPVLYQIMILSADDSSLDPVLLLVPCLSELPNDLLGLSTETDWAGDVNVCRFPIRKICFAWRIHHSSCKCCRLICLAAL